MNQFSDRANRVWLRMQQMFGDKLRAMYPAGMPHAMAQTVDRVDDDTVKNGLSAMSKMKQPPTGIQFEQVMGSVPAEPPKPNMMGLLTQYVVDYCKPSLKQLQMPWTWKWNGACISSVEIPPDGSKSGFSVSIDILQMLDREQMEKLKRLDVAEERQKARLEIEALAAGMRA